MLLAAGAGSRLGTPKALVEVAGVRLVDRGTGLLRAGGADPVVVVTGAAPVTLPGVITVFNPDWATGMGSSLAAGLRSVPDDCAAAVVALVDQPLVGPAAVRRLIGAHASGAGVAVAAYTAGPATRCCWPVSTGRRSSTWPPVTPARGRSCARTRSWSRWWSARTPASRTTWTPRRTWPG